MNKVLIDGEVRNSDDVDPRIHVWIGSFRPPKGQIGKYSDVELSPFPYYYDRDQMIKASCEEYNSGIYDIPQYKTFNDSDWLEKFKEGAQKIILELAEEVEKQRLK